MQQVIDEDSHHLAERNSLEHHSKSQTKFSSVCVQDNSLIALDEGKVREVFVTQNSNLVYSKYYTVVCPGMLSQSMLRKKNMK